MGCCTGGVCLSLVSKPLCSSKKKLFIIYGKWTECLWGIDPVAYESFRKQERRGEPPRKAQPVRRRRLLPGSFLSSASGSAWAQNGLTGTPGATPSGC